MAEENDNLNVDKNSGLGFSEKMAAAAKVSAKELGDAILQTYNVQVKLNESFGQGQERLSEMVLEISNAAPRISRLGGSIADVQSTMIAISESSRRNVIANAQDVEKLYAATKVVGGSAESLTKSFLDIGVGISEIPKQLESSVNYIRSIGGNTKAVMSDVADNMAEMNRYQFQGGVQGLTKMAAQASMLRFDMSNTFALAEKVLDPEGAIEMASAFQRLGVSAGNLTDPFQLMNQSINDPSGLQTSLAEVSKQFTYFDEETKTFKINPQGVLTLRQMEKEAGLAQGSLSKMGLAAAELDKRISAVNMAGLTIASEEDKQYLANIATMQDGKYKVTLEDDTKKELAELTQPEFDKLIEQQKTGPKTLEDIAKLQLSIDEAMLADIRGLRDSFTFGVTSAKQIRQGTASLQRVSKTTLGEASDAIKAKDFRKLSEGIIDNLGMMVTDYKEGNNVLLNSQNRFNATLEDSLKQFSEVFKDIRERSIQKLSAPDGGKMEGSNVSEIVKSSTGNLNVTPTTPLSSTIINNRVETLQNSLNNPTGQINKNEVNVSGTIKVDLSAPAGVTTQDQQKYFADIINSPQFKDQIVSIVSPKNPTKQPNNNVYV